MKSKYQILCPEYVPLENKGEEAIIRGVIDVVFPDHECEYHIIDNNSKIYYQKGDLHVHPGELFFSDWRSREFGLGPSFNQIYSSACSIVRNGLNKFFPWWALRPHRKARNLRKYLSNKKKIPLKYRESIEQLKKIDYIIAGHNGGLNEYVCHILNELHRINISFGIFGSSMKPKLNNKIILTIFNKTFNYSNFNIVRNPIGFEWAKEKFSKIEFNLNPDPAFAMKPIDPISIDSLIERLGLKDFFEKPVLMITTAEPAPISRHSFDNIPGMPLKIKAHRNFLAGLVRKIYENNNLNILFLPHTIGPSKSMDDRLISKNVIENAKLTGNSRVKLLEADLSARELKGLISKADFLLAERLHSIIGAIGVNTPFMCLASKNDLRVKGILKIQLGFQDQIYYLNNPGVDSAYQTFNVLLSKKGEFKTKLKEKNTEIYKQLETTGQFIRNIILQ